MNRRAQTQKLLLIEKERGREGRKDGGKDNKNKPKRTLGVVLLRSLDKAVQARAPGLDGVSAGEGGQAHVHLNTRDHAGGVQVLDEGGAVHVVLKGRK